MNKNVEQAKQMAAERKARLEKEAKEREETNKARNLLLVEAYAECKKVLADFHNVETTRGKLTHDNTTLRLGTYEFLRFSASWEMQRVGVDDYEWESSLMIHMHWFDHNGADQWQAFGSVDFFRQEVVHKVSEIL